MKNARVSEAKLEQNCDENQFSSNLAAVNLTVMAEYIQLGTGHAGRQDRNSKRSSKLLLKFSNCNGCF